MLLCSALSLDSRIRDDFFLSFMTLAVDLISRSVTTHMLFVFQSAKLPLGVRLHNGLNNCNLMTIRRSFSSLSLMCAVVIVTG